MKTVYSIGVGFASHGMGTIGYYAARALYRRGILERVLCAYHTPKEIPGELICDILPGGLVAEKALIVSARLFGSHNGYALKGATYDYLASKRIPGCDIFHGWSLMCHRSLATAKAGGAQTVVERPNSHMIYQKKILEEEFILQGVDTGCIDDLEVKLNLREYDAADYVFVPSEFVRKTFQEQGFDMRKVKVIPYGYDHEVFKPRPKPRDRFRVLFSGHISLRKGVPYLLEAWRSLGLEDAELVLAGKVFPEMKKTLAEYVKSCGNIRVRGFVPPARMVDEYNNANVFVFPSIDEGFALVIFEALGCGLPVVTTTNSGGSDIIGDGVEGFILGIRDAKGLADKIKYLYDNRDEVSAMGERAYGRGREYTWDRYGINLVNLYRKILDE